MCLYYNHAIKSKDKIIIEDDFHPEPTLGELIKFICYRIAGKFSKVERDMYVRETGLHLDLEQMLNQAGLSSSLITAKLINKYIKEWKQSEKGCPLSPVVLDDVDMLAQRTLDQIEEGLLRVENCDEQVVTISNFSASLPYLAVGLKNSSSNYHMVAGLIDSGCSTLILRSDVLSKLGYEINQLQPMPNTAVKSASGTMQVLGKKSFRFLLKDIHGKWYETMDTDLTVLQYNPHLPALIIGWNYLRKINFSWKSKNNTDILTLDCFSNNDKLVRREFPLARPNADISGSMIKRDSNNLHFITSSDVDEAISYSFNGCNVKLTFENTTASALSDTTLHTYLVSEVPGGSAADISVLSGETTLNPNIKETDISGLFFNLDEQLDPALESCFEQLQLSVANEKHFSYIVDEELYDENGDILPNNDMIIHYQDIKEFPPLSGEDKHEGLYIMQYNDNKVVPYDQAIKNSPSYFKSPFSSNSEENVIFDACAERTDACPPPVKQESTIKLEGGKYLIPTFDGVEDDIKDKLIAIATDYKHNFATHRYDFTPSPIIPAQTLGVDMTKTVIASPRKYSDVEIKELTTFCEGMISAGAMIELSKPPQLQFSVFLVPKDVSNKSKLDRSYTHVSRRELIAKSGARITQDLRAINAVSTKQAVPVLENILTLLPYFSGALIYSLDLQQAYYQLRTVEHEHKNIGFLHPTQNKWYALTCLYQGATNSVSICQMVMTGIVLSEDSWQQFQNKMNKRYNTDYNLCRNDIIKIFIDDLIILPPNKHLKLLSFYYLMEQFSHYQLKLSPGKCTFDRKKIEVLGYTVSQESQTYFLSEARISALVNQPFSYTPRELKGLMAKHSYFTAVHPGIKHILLFSKLQSTNKSGVLTFNKIHRLEQASAAFIVWMQVNLFLPNPRLPIFAACDASATSASVVCFQRQKLCKAAKNYWLHPDNIKSPRGQAVREFDESFVPIILLQKYFTPEFLKKSSFVKELFCLLYFLLTCERLIRQAPVTVISVDCLSVLYLSRLSTISSRYFNYSMYIQSFNNIKVLHNSDGYTLQGLVDILSRNLRNISHDLPQQISRSLLEDMSTVAFKENDLLSPEGLRYILNCPSSNHNMIASRRQAGKDLSKFDNFPDILDTWPCEDEILSRFLSPLTKEEIHERIQPSSIAFTNNQNKILSKTEFSKLIQKNKFNELSDMVCFIKQHDSCVHNVNKDILIKNLAKSLLAYLNQAFPAALGSLKKKLSDFVSIDTPSPLEQTSLLTEIDKNFGLTKAFGSDKLQAITYVVLYHPISFSEHFNLNSNHLGFQVFVSSKILMEAHESRRINLNLFCKSNCQAKFLLETVEKQFPINVGFILHKSFSTDGVLIIGLTLFNGNESSIIIPENTQILNIEFVPTELCACGERPTLMFISAQTNQLDHKFHVLRGSENFVANTYVSGMINVDTISLFLVMSNEDAFNSLIADELMNNISEEEQFLLTIVSAEKELDFDKFQANKLISLGYLLTKHKTLDMNFFEQMQSSDPAISQLKTLVLSDKTTAFTMRNNIVYKICLKDNQNLLLVCSEWLIKSIIECLHNNFYYHISAQSMYSLLSRSIFHKRLKQICLNTQCGVCSMTNLHKSFSFMADDQIKYLQPGKYLCSDIFSSLPTSSKGYKHVLLLVEPVSRMTFMAALKEETGEQIVPHFLSIFRFWLPEYIVTDFGPCYRSEKFKNLLKDFHVGHLKSSPHSSTENGIAEAHVKITRLFLKKMLASLPTDNLKSWEHYLPKVNCIFNNTFLSSNNKTSISRAEGFFTTGFYQPFQFLSTMNISNENYESYIESVQRNLDERKRKQRRRLIDNSKQIHSGYKYGQFVKVVSSKDLNKQSNISEIDVSTKIGKFLGENRKGVRVLINNKTVSTFPKDRVHPLDPSNLIANHPALVSFKMGNFHKNLFVSGRQTNIFEKMSSVDEAADIENVKTFLKINDLDAEGVKLDPNNDNDVSNSDSPDEDEESDEITHSADLHSHDYNLRSRAHKSVEHLYKIKRVTFKAPTDRKKNTRKQNKFLNFMHDYNTLFHRSDLSKAEISILAAATTC